MGRLKLKCPFCDGKKYLELEQTKANKELKEYLKLKHRRSGMVKLRKQGLTLREIGVFVDLSPQGVKDVLDKTLT